MTCGECKHFDLPNSHGYGDCSYPLPKYIVEERCEGFMHETDANPCPCFERKEEK